MGGFLKWYINLLKTRPLATNMGSAAILMTAGDVLAQELEHSSDVAKEVVVGKEKPLPTAKIPEETKGISLKRYGTLNPSLAQSNAIHDYEQTKHKHGHHNNHHKVQQKDKNANDKNITTTDDDENTITRIRENIMQIIDAVQAELEFWDKYRTSTMIVWSAGAYTPLYVMLYKICDKYMPQQTPMTISARVLLSFLLSVPINAGFFTYGVFVHHSAEWLAIQREWAALLEEMGVSNDMIDPYGSAVPYDVDLFWQTAKLKLDSELYTTVVDSAKVWVPINIMNFTVIPPHFRPVILLTFSVFWNAYLSLAQHRDLSLPSDDIDS